LFTSLPIEKLDAVALKTKVSEIGRMEGASAAVQ
jgi:hypothetical protein